MTQAHGVTRAVALRRQSMEFEQDRQPRRSAAYWQWTLIISVGMLIAVTSFAAGILADRPSAPV